MTNRLVHNPTWLRTKSYCISTTGFWFVRFSRSLRSTCWVSNLCCDVLLNVSSCASDKRYHFRKCQASPLINSLQSVHRWNGGFLIIENFQRLIHVFNLSYSDHCQMMTHHYWAGSMRLCSFYDDKTQKGQPVVNYQRIISNNVPFPLCIGGLEFSENQCTLYNLTRIPTILLDNN